MALAISIDIVNVFNSLLWNKIKAGHRLPLHLRRIVKSYLNRRSIEFPAEGGITVSRSISYQPSTMVGSRFALVEHRI